MKRALRGLFLPLWVWLAASQGVAFAQMDLRQASGVPLPDGSLPVGTVSVRVVRGSFANNLAGVDVTFDVDGKTTVQKTDSGGRTQMIDIRRGAKVTASAVVGDEHLRSQPVTIETSGIRFVLVASGGAATGSAALAPIKGTVTLGPDSRIVADYADERLNVYYAVQIVNTNTAPVDTGGPVILALPAAARGASLMEGSSPTATVTGARVTVLGPFAPGATNVNVAFELPYSGAVAHLEQQWPVASQGTGVFAIKSGEIDLASTQLTAKQSSVQQGQPLVMGLLPAVPAGQTLSLDITGLPHRSLWPRYIALGAAGLITLLGLWGAFGPTSRRRVA